MNNYPLLNFQTESFFFSLYADTELEKKMIQELKDDLETKEFLPDFLKYIQETRTDLEEQIDPIRFTSIVYYQNYPIGLISFYDIGNELVFSQGIIPSQRGKGLSSMIRKEVYQYVFENIEGVEKITAYIDNQNMKSLHALGKFGCDEMEEICDEQGKKQYFKITNYNPILMEQKREM